MKKVRLVSVLLILSITSSQAQVADTQTQKRIFDARNRVMPALVHVQPILKNYQTGEMEKQAVIGSGVIFSKDGYVVTNYHVAGKADRIFCTLSDREVVPAVFVGGDPLTDISVLKLDLSEYTGQIKVAEFGNSDSVEVGQFVLAMGSPLSLSRSISFGVISTKDRYISSDIRLPSGENTGRYNLWLQTDAAINPGNSGGPLVDLDGEVIGINSRASMFANNIGFAIPINIVKRVTAEIIDHGKVIRSWIGLYCQPLQDLETHFKADVNRGVLVSSVDKDSPAEQSFLKAGDIILDVDSIPVSARFVEELPRFYDLIASYKPGAEISFKVLRDGQQFTVKVKTKELGDLQGEDFECPAWSFTVKAITRQMQLENNLDSQDGVFVTGVKSSGPGRSGGLRSGDVIFKINSESIKNLDGFIALYDRLSIDSSNVMLNVKRGGSTKFVVLDVKKMNGEESSE